MNLTLVKNAVTSRAGRQILLAKKNSPVVLFAAGLVSVSASTVLACKATLQLEEVVQEAEVKRSQINAALTDPELMDKYTARMAARDKHVVRVQTAANILRLYGPAIGFGIVGVGLLTGSHVVLTRRNTAVMAAYAALEKAYHDYRARVSETYGEDAERKIYTAGKSEMVKTGEGKKQEITYSDRDGKMSLYARLWDWETSTSWQKQPEYNLAFITSKQNYLNDRLKARGHVFLNEAYDELGLDRTTPGSVVGWLLGSDGDGYIDFGLVDTDDPERVLDFISGKEGGIWLDFNVDGMIYNLI